MYRNCKCCVYNITVEESAPPPPTIGDGYHIFFYDRCMSYCFRYQNHVNVFSIIVLIAS